MNFSQRGWLTNKPTDWLIWMAGWLTDWLTDLNRVTNWLTDLASQIDGLGNSLTEKLTDILRGFGWLNYWPTDRQTEWPAGWLTDLLLTRGLTDQLPGNCLTELMELSWREPFNQNSNRSDREKWSTSKGGPVFSKLFRLDRTDRLSFGPKFPEILVEWIAPSVCVAHYRINFLYSFLRLDNHFISN